MEKETVVVPFDWPKHLSKVLVQHDEVPLFGRAPSFRWEEFSEKLAKLFELDGLSVACSPPEWRTAEQLTEGMGTGLLPLEVRIAPLEGELWWIVDHTAVQRMMGWTLTKGTNTEAALDGDLVSAFYHFAALEAVHHYTQLCGDPDLSPSFSATDTLPQTEALGIDVEIRYQEASVWGRLLLSPAFRASYKKHYEAAPQRQTLPAVSQDIPVTVHVEVGKTEIPLNQWKSITPGDIILLDSCTAPPDEDKARATLSVNGKPIFRARIKDNQLKILEFPLTQEA